MDHADEHCVNAVKDILVELGISEDRIDTRAEGSCTQVYNQNELNRTVIIKLK